jgi:hypothetical protein
MSKKTEKVPVVPFRMIVLAAEELDFNLANEDKLAILLVRDFLKQDLRVLVSRVQNFVERERERA